ncbi:chitin synthase chs-2-like [Hemitrygon akajei]|uniref:chitin synthase chs-2-like n=1 Tax=Hemitrygon akajei TaxID=2704970 RepID=UPI003BF9DAA6
MENSTQSKQEVKNAWDTFYIHKVRDEEESQTKFMGLVRFLCCVGLGLFVLSLAFLSKVSLLLIISATGDVSVYFTNKPFSHLILGCVLIVPSILTIAKCLWKFSFLPESMLPARSLITVCLLEAVASFGTTMLVVVCLPQFDILTNVFISNSVYLIPSVLQVISLNISHRFKVTAPLAGLLILLCAYGLFLFVQMFYLKKHDVVYLGLIVLFSVITSLTWWENFISNWKHPMFRHLRYDLNKSRNVLSLCISVVRIVVTACVVGALIPIRELEWATISDVASHEIRIILGLFGVQAVASMLCSWFGGVACKVHAVKRSFGLPLILNTPVMLTFLLVVFRIHHNEFLQTNNNFNISDFCANSRTAVNETVSVDILFSEIIRSICEQGDLVNMVSVGLVGAAGALWWVGLIFTTIYVWTQNVNRIQRTSETFVRRIYGAAFLEQSMLLNKRFHISPQNTEESNPSRKSRRENLMIYVCVTLWHESTEEMLHLISSLFRLDRFSEKRWKALDKSDDIFDFEVHIMFDDAFRNVTDKEVGTKKRVINEYVESLIKAVDENYRIFQTTTSRSSSDKDENGASGTKVISTPYGGRLSYTLPCGNGLHVHLKDMEFVQNRKRWSQVMCMYYVLGWRLYRKHFICQHLHPEDGTIILGRLETEKKNTYILTLDGDIEFQPSAVTLLIDRLRRYPKVGAACGRVHPVGIGPMVWYQKFEYAVSHWLQKTSEHVLGCVLCSPGCFSLFRAAALMDDNVLKKYAMKPMTAVEHLQYDQGEDRWLCLLLLQQGWRIEYCGASDSYTNAPQEFKEFFNQRRRWDPSKIANIIELLGNGFETSRKNPSVSRPFLLYQILYLMATLVGPSTVCFLIAAALSFFSGWDYNRCLIISVIPPIIYLIVCYTTTPNTQIRVAAFFTAVYTLAMIGGVLAAFGMIISDGTFVSPIGIFITSLVLLYFVSALLHPTETSLVIYGFLYLLCIPAASMLQPIYSLANLHVTSWGTREKKPKQQNGSSQNDQHLRYQRGRWHFECTIRCQKAQHPTKGTFEKINETDEVTEKLESPVENCWLSELKKTTLFTEDSLEEDESLFWSKLIQVYLKPLSEDKYYLKTIKRELLTLRNKALFLYLMINLLWLVGSFLLQLVTDGIISPKLAHNGTVVKNEYLKIQPLTFVFLAIFAFVIFIQFLAMLYHRVYTFIHWLSHSSTNASQSHNKEILTKAMEDVKKQQPKECY